MDKADLETYQVQLSQVEGALSADPENNELLSLRSELKELISLTQAALQQQGSSSASASASSTSAASVAKREKAAAAAASSSATWGAGDEVLAKYSGDGQWYPARIASVGGSSENHVYSVVFKGYNNTELVNAGQVKSLPGNYQGAVVGGGGVTGGIKRKLSKEEEEEEREKKKKKNERKVQVRVAKAQEQKQKQASWQKFAKKSEKKGVHIAGTAGTSIFKTPENPLGRVGVTGSGKGMTEVAPRIKHKFEATDDQAA